MAKCQYKPSQEILDNLGQEDYSCELEAYDGHERCLLHLNKYDSGELGFIDEACVDLVAKLIYKYVGDSFKRKNKNINFYCSNFKHFLNLFLKGSQEDRLRFDEQSNFREIKSILSNEVNIVFCGFDFRSIGGEAIQKIMFYISRLKKSEFYGCSFSGEIELGRASVVFLDCSFENLDCFFSKEEKIFFGCSFYKETCIFFSQGVDSVTIDIFDNCTFYGEVGFFGGDLKNRLKVYEIMDGHCFFSKGASFNFFSFEGDSNPAKLLGWTYASNDEFGPLRFSNCIFNCDFLIGGQHVISFEKDSGIDDCTLPEVHLSDLEVNGKFEMKDRRFLGVFLDNVKFNKVSDFNSSRIDCIEMSRVDFLKFAAFENIVIKDKVILEFVTFHSHATFRGAKFLGGLNLDRANFSGEANFLDVDVDACIEGESEKLKSTRETYRLIKHSFDKIGNHLEANKFFAKEMDKYREELDEGRTLLGDIFRPEPYPRNCSSFFSTLSALLLAVFTIVSLMNPGWLLLAGMVLSFLGLLFNGRISHVFKGLRSWISGLSTKVPVYWFNKFSSDFGQSYIRPAVGMLALLSVHVLSISYFGSSLDLEDSYNPCSLEMSGILGYLNCGASLFPFSNVLISGMELLSLVFYLTFAALFWQFVVALKRHTRR